jgi:hypothetical protein
MSLNLPVLIRVEIEEIIYFICPLRVIGIVREYLVRPLSCFNFTRLLGISNMIIGLCVMTLWLSTNFSYNDLIVFLEIRITHYRLQNLALQPIGNEFSVEAALQFAQ